MSKPTDIRLSIDRGVAELTLARPTMLNALRRRTLIEVIDALHQVADDPAARCLLITGEGRGFCAGADLAALGKESLTADGTVDVGEAMEKFFNPMMAAIRALPKPVVAAVNGVAAGGGCNLALAADIVLAARSAKFVQVFVRIGLMPDLGGTWFPQRNVGDARARAAAMLGEDMTAERAEAQGLIWKVCDDATLMDEARALARALAAGPTRSYAAIKHALNVASTNTLVEQLALERDLQRELGRSEDFREGVAAFLQKRPAQFAGR